jgi:hypothetical protein
LVSSGAVFGDRGLGLGFGVGECFDVVKEWCLEGAVVFEGV